MELIVQILMFFIVINSLLKLSFWKLWQAALMGLACGAFLIGTCRYAILQSKTQLTDWLTNTTIMENMAVLVTVESVICFAFCMVSLNQLFENKLSRWSKILQGYVSLLLFPILFYCLSQFIFFQSGSSFTSLAWGLAVIVSIALPLCSYLIKRLVQEKDLRLELHFILSLFVCVLGLLSTVNGNVGYAVQEPSFDIEAIALASVVFVVAFAAGFAWNRFKSNY